ncbi:hypothetical protein [Leptospira yasudae]|uniref:Glycosyltransferase RgtA/B/C/D-like domain-containing protein n=1 Tax=Leptospira yasudae TaxID=2202201 RepID=A0A6N4QIR8_9LEPT|nr:hypothetical protein [Leptospira yasudae]TGL79619.1 hypothetical protein EHQ83_18200 [Leptospira yasudae]TGL81355.1 hypothetical protein EHQ72_05395 [Leptospira yasudae]TGL81801.1 hypothetical protein EHQ77_06960 [Leptospira yasudae]
MWKYVLSLILFFLSLFYSLTRSPEGIYLNSDILYLPALALDVFRDGGNFLSWSFTPSPYFFPDFPIVSILLLFFENAYQALLCFAFLQTITFTVLMERFWIFTKEERNRKKLSKKEARRVKAWVLLLISFLLLAANRFPTLYILFLPSIHASAFLIALYVWPLIHQRMEKRNAIFLFLWIALTTASDRILFIELIVPGILAGFAFSFTANPKEKEWKRYFPESSKLLLFAGSAGLILHAILKSFLYIEKAGRIPAQLSLAQVTKDGIRFFTEARLWITSGLQGNVPVPAILLLLLAFAFLVGLKRIRKTKSTAFLFFFFAILALAPVATGSYIDEYSLRYAAPALILAPFFLCFVAGFPKRYLTLGIFLLFLLLLFLGQKSTENGQNQLIRLSPRVPQETACIDTIAEKTPISLVVSDFWAAKRIFVFSKKKIHSVHVAYGTLEGSHTISNKDRYLQNYTGTVAVFTKGFGELRIREVYGVPSKRFPCEDEAFLLYEDSRRIQEALRRPFQKTK